MTEGERVMVVRLLAPAPALTMNDRLYWRAKARLTREWRHATHMAACADLGVSPELRRREPCLVRVEFPTDRPNQRRDPHNWAPTIKAIVDGLCDAGVWPDDTAEYVDPLNARFYKPTIRAAAADVIVTLIPRAGALPE